LFVATAVAAGLVATKGEIDPAAHTEVIDFGKFVCYGPIRFART
jgi:hypothetical protein